MKNYEKPVVMVNEELAEGVYAASGDKAANVNAETSGPKYKCESIYMNGVYQQGTWNPIEDGYKKGRGCEGCPAQNGNSCRFVTAPEQMNWDGDFRPSWEVAGHKPDEKGY